MMYLKKNKLSILRVEVEWPYVVSALDEGSSCTSGFESWLGTFCCVLGQYS